MKNKSVAGVTLSELMIATLILAFVLIGILSLFINCMLLNESNRNLTIAASHAQYILEEIRSTNFDQIETKINNSDWDLNETEIKTAPYNLTALDSEAIDTNVIQTGDPLGISVTVNWSDRGQRQRSTELQTFITDYQ